MEANKPEVVAEVRELFERCERVLIDKNVDVLDAYDSGTWYGFDIHAHPSVFRRDGYGFDEARSTHITFAGRRTEGTRARQAIDILTLGDDFATVNLVFEVIDRGRTEDRIAKEARLGAVAHLSRSEVRRPDSNFLLERLFTLGSPSSRTCQGWGEDCRAGQYFPSYGRRSCRWNIRSGDDLMPDCIDALPDLRAHAAKSILKWLPVRHHLDAGDGRRRDFGSNVLCRRCGCHEWRWRSMSWVSQDAYAYFLRLNANKCDGNVAVIDRALFLNGYPFFRHWRLCELRD